MTRKLEIRMLHYFLLITLAAVMIGIGRRVAGGWIPFLPNDSTGQVG